MFFQQRNQITYSLRAKDGHQGSGAGVAAKRPDHLLSKGRRWPPKVSSRFCSKETRSLTLLGQEVVTKGSAVGLQQIDQITYSLEVGDGHQRVSSRFCSKETRSLTVLGQEVVTKGSAVGFAAKRPDHLQPEGRRWPG